MSHRTFQPSDEQLERALARRASHGPDADLLHLVTAVVTTTPQARRRWPISLPGMDESARRLIWLAIVVTLVTAFALGSLVAGGVNDASTVAPAPTASPAWTTTGSLVTPRTLHTATLLADGRVLVAGGRAGGTDDDAPLASAELYDPVTGSWAPTRFMTIARSEPTATLLRDGRVLVAGGDGPDGTALASAEVYDPITGTWSPTGPMSHAFGHTATLLPDGQVLVAGGDYAERFDPIAGSWTPVATPHAARRGHSATLLTDGTVLVAGGYSGNWLDSFEIYDPVGDSWSVTEHMTEPYSGHTATLLPDGDVLIVGGVAPGPAGASASRHVAQYDSATGTWSATADTSTPRLGHVAALLTDGRVLVAGGRAHGGGDAPLVADAEIYDPVTRTWTTVGGMEVGRSESTVTLLADGAVLVTGGLGEGCADRPHCALSAAELFTAPSAP